MLLAINLDLLVDLLSCRRLCPRFLWHEPSQTDLLFVTLNKSEALFSPSNCYRDLALAPSQFHGESQSTTTTASATGSAT
nr:hypothetical protein [Synechococcus sp. 1G10]